jgi:hypothetical protein
MNPQRREASIELKDRRIKSLVKLSEALAEYGESFSGAFSPAERKFQMDVITPAISILDVTFTESPEFIEIFGEDHLRNCFVFVNTAVMSNMIDKLIVSLVGEIKI